MNMLFQHILFISLNLHHTKVQVQHHEYIITSMILQYITISYKAIKKLMSRYTVLEDRPVQITKSFAHYNRS